MSAAFDLCILGAGFGGSLLALLARRLGLRVLLLERGSHPRFAIGESTSPLCNLLLEELATTYDLPRLIPLTAYGSWKRVYPGIAVGLKRGFTFYQHPSGSPRPPARARLPDGRFPARRPGRLLGQPTRSRTPRPAHRRPVRNQFRQLARCRALRPVQGSTRRPYRGWAREPGR